MRIRPEGFTEYVGILFSSTCGLTFEQHLLDLLHIYIEREAHIMLCMFHS